MGTNGLDKKGSFHNSSFIREKRNSGLCRKGNVRKKRKKKKKAAVFKLGGRRGKRKTQHIPEERGG